MVKKVKNIHMHFLREIPGIIEQKNYCRIIQSNMGKRVDLKQLKKQKKRIRNI